ncbi:MAG: sugar phosphate isomerase/epimerase [Clostridiales bacterium]|jgi:sugar phosphate isomerase/epimerase|nr:sugar phosphate isomerase/epimerase [Clostridiales bacterium]
MKLGIITSHDRTGIKQVADLGLKYAEFDVNGDDISYLTGNEEGIKAAMGEFGVEIAAVGRWGRNRLNSDLTVNTKEQKDEFDLIDFCVNVGCPVYITGINYVNGFSYYSNVSAAIGYIKSLIAYANGKVKICTYNCEWNSYVDKPREWDIIHDHIKELGIKYDPSHAVNAGRDYMAEIVKYGNRVYHIHLKGTINSNGIHLDDPPAGMDMINWSAFVSVFRRFGYDGVLSIEPHSATWTGELGEKGLKYTIKYFKSLLFEE